MSTTLLLRKETVQQPYKLTCRFTVDAPLRGIKTERWLDYAQREYVRCCNQFVRDMEKQGWKFVGGGLPFSGGPYSYIDPRGVPKRPIKPARQKGRPSAPIAEWDKVDWGHYTENVVTVQEHERWDYEFYGIFTKPMQVEVDDRGPSSEVSMADYLKETA